MLKVMIADDNDGMRLILKKAVEKSGHAVAGEARGGEEAVRMAEELHPDVIFMDIEMPDIDGVEAAAVFRTSTPGSSSSLPRRMRNTARRPLSFTLLTTS